MGNNCNGYEEVIEICNCPRLGEPAPDFEADTTHGIIKLSEYNKDHWVILFSHPADFTPVCTTEFMAFAEKQEEFDKRKVKLLGLSIDSVYSHIAWVREIEKMFEVKIKFPIIADIPMEVAHLYSMIQPAISEVHAIRTVFIIDPQGILKTMIYYPSSVGRNIDEIIRMIDALQVVEKENVATPVNWKPGENVIVPPPKTVEEAEKTTHGEHEECKNWFLCKKKL
ncbi:MAG: peroxiredoxin [Bacteroidota bacterium]|nr:peroxiredoxin [Bacteroidota bacterium]